MTSPAPSVVALLLLLAGVGSGGRLFGITVLIAAVIALVALATAVDATGPRPIVAASAIAALGVPVRLVIDQRVRLDAVPPLVAAMVVGAFVLSMISGRRADVARVLSATSFCGLIVALGAAGLLLLRDARGGLRWTLGLLLLIVVPELAALVAARVRGMSLTGREAVRIVAAAAVGGALLAIAGRPLTPAVTAGMVALSLGAMYAAALLHRVIHAESAAGDQAARLGLRPTVSLLLAAPLVALLAAAVQA